MAASKFVKHFTESELFAAFKLNPLEIGHLEAQIWLGNYYNGGIMHCEVFDQHKALEWFEKSTGQGHAPYVQKVKELNDKGLYSSQKLKVNVRN